MPRFTHVTFVSLMVLALGACAPQSPRIPILEGSGPTGQRPVEDTPDWQDWGPEQNRAGRAGQIEGERIGGQALSRALVGEVLRGCYPNGERFAERLRTDGRFTDAAISGEPVLGTYEITGEGLCFDYTERQGRTCFAVFRQGGGLSFYDASLRRQVAEAPCRS